MALLAQHRHTSILFKLLASSLIIPQIPFVHAQDMLLNRMENTDPVEGYISKQLRSRINVDSVVIQKASALGTTYHAVEDPNGHPVFSRGLIDHGKLFILFVHPSFPGGSGHYVILRRMVEQTRLPGIGTPMGIVGRTPYLFYEAFVLNFKDSLHGSVSDLDPFMYAFMQRRLGRRNDIRRRWRRKRINSMSRSKARYMKKRSVDNCQAPNSGKDGGCLSVKITRKQFQLRRKK